VDGGQSVEVHGIHGDGNVVMTEPGLGKTAQALLAAEAAGAYPLLVVMPNVVKTNWAREASAWVPHRPATMVQGDGQAVDGGDREWPN
jgi:SNF2 family DNA or RNA helicase